MGAVLNILVAKKSTNPTPNPCVGLLKAVAMPVPHPTTKSKPRNLFKSLGSTTDLRTALIITELNAALGVGDRIAMYGRRKIQQRAVIKAES